MKTPMLALAALLNLESVDDDGRPKYGIKTVLAGRYTFDDARTRARQIGAEGIFEPYPSGMGSVYYPPLSVPKVVIQQACE